MLDQPAGRSRASPTAATMDVYDTGSGLRSRLFGHRSAEVVQRSARERWCWSISAGTGPQCRAEKHADGGIQS
jgi:hypothetical protein